MTRPTLVARKARSRGARARVIFHRFFEECRVELTTHMERARAVRPPKNANERPDEPNRPKQYCEWPREKKPWPEETRKVHNIDGIEIPVIHAEDAGGRSEQTQNDVRGSPRYSALMMDALRWPVDGASVPELSSPAASWEIEGRNETLAGLSTVSPLASDRPTYTRCVAGALRKW